MKQSLAKFSFVFAVFSFVLIACNKKESIVSNPLEFSEFIESFGPSVSSRLDEIYIGINQTRFLELNENLIKSNFKISPQIEGEIEIRNSNLIVFSPTKPLKSGQIYNINLGLKSLVPEGVKLPANNFQFSTKVIPQNANISIQDYVYENEQWTCTARLIFNDAMDVETVKKAVEVTNNTTSIPFELTSNNTYEYYIKSKFDDKTKGEIDFNIDGDIINMEKDVSNSFGIPLNDDFNLLKVIRENEKLNFIFSQVLDQNQDLSGLIRIGSSKQTPVYEIDGNRLFIFPEKNGGENELISIQNTMKSANGLSLNSSINYTLDDGPIMPQLKNVGIGHILPNSDQVIFPFEAQGLKSVQIEVFKIFGHNVSQFFQQHSISNYYNLEYVGEFIHRETLTLESMGKVYDPSTMNRYYFNIGEFTNNDKNALYEVRIAFLPEDIYNTCGSDLEYELPDKETSLLDLGYYGVGGRYSDFNWDDRDNPCKLGYYNSSKYIRKLIHATDLGIVAKKTSNGDIQVVVNDIVTSLPISGANVTLYSKAMRPLITSKTDSDGFILASNMEDAYLVKVTKSNDENWLKIENRNALSFSKFDVGGRTKKNGIDGFIYGERNIWRPGDTMFVDFILFDKENRLPKEHPVKLVLESAQGKVLYSKTSVLHNGPIYPFVIPTKRDFITGDYTIHAYLGGNVFSKFVKLENIKPNKIAVKTDIEGKDLSKFRNEIFNNGKTISYDLMWLYGAPAKNKRLTVELNMNNARASFKTFPDYSFENPRSEWYPSESKIIADTKTDDFGKANFKLKLDKSILPKGKLKLSFKNTAYEDSGDFSIDAFSTLFSPYNSFVGIKLPKDQYNYERVSKNKDATIQLASVQSDGEPKNNTKLSVNVYRMKNYWWYNNYNNGFDLANTSAHIGQSEFSVKTDSQGKAKVTTQFRTNGRYFIQVCDESSGHCTGDYLYVGYAWDDDEMSTAQYEEAAQLNLSPVKDSYTLKETVEILVPSYFKGRALVSLENGDKIVESFWTNVERGNNKIKFTPQLEMFPTVYVHVTLLQEHASKANDMPIRLYGVTPVNISDQSLKLEPKLNLPKELKPNEKFEVTIKESNGKDMFYTLAVVDEGLLNISRFKTPDPFNHFYSRPALGVRTFDVYNDVLSAYGSELSGLLSIGGDMENIQIEEDERANRFKPVVQHLGPFYLKSGSKNTHEISMPNYVGAIRMMVVSANKNAFGNTETIVPVKQDLMVLATVPRTLSPGDNFNLPITLISMKENVGNVEYGIQQKGDLIKFEQGSNSKAINDIDETIEFVNANVGQKEGIAKLDIYAKSSKITSSQQIEVDVLNPNPVIRRTVSKYLSPGETYKHKVTPIGSINSEVILSFSSVSPVNISAYLDQLARYPYGCLEQRISASFAALHQGELMEISAQEKAYNKTVVTDLINELYRFQNYHGYSLWPGNTSYNDWISSYVGDFIYVAKEKGYQIPESIKNKWIDTQTKKASNWVNETNVSPRFSQQSLLQQAYRLFTLAQMGKPMLNEMNRLKEDHALDNYSKIMLSAAYTIAGRTDISSTLMDQGIADDSLDEQFNYNTYNSYTRNLALQIILYNELKDFENMSKVAKALNEQLLKDRYVSTHDAAFIIRAMACMNSQFGNDKTLSVSIAYDGKSKQNLVSEQNQISIQSNLVSSTEIETTNNGESGVYVCITKYGKEDIAVSEAKSMNLILETKYVDLQGNSIDPQSIQQGTDFKIIQKIKRAGNYTHKFEDLALRQIFPAGWEITNDRVFNLNQENQQLEYQDFKDNLVNSFFELGLRESVTIETKLKATYKGTYFHPKIICESMYADDIYAEKGGFLCKVY